MAHETDHGYGHATHGATHPVNGEYSAEQIARFQRDDIRAVKDIVGLMLTVFSVGLVGAATISMIVWPK